MNNLKGQYCKFSYLLLLVLCLFLNQIARAQSFAISPRFDYAASFSDGVAHVTIKDKDYYINKLGRIVVTPGKFDQYFKFSEGFAGVRNISSSKEGFIDKTGKLVIPLKFSYVKNFKEGRAVVSFSPLGTITSEKGVIDRDGRYVRNPHLEYIFDFNEGFATANFGIIGQPTVGMIDRDGKTVLSGRFTWMSSLIGGVAAALSPNEGWGLVKPDGSWAVPPRFDWLGNLDRGLIAYGDCGGKRWQPWFAGTQTCRYGFINKSGDIVIPSQFTFAGSFSEDRAVVSFSESVDITFDSENRQYSSIGKKATFGYIDRTGRLIIDPVYEEVSDFIEGVAAVLPKGSSNVESRYGYIDVRGKPVSDFTFIFANPVSEGLAAVKTQSGKWGFIRFN